jgi:hypothetical protein
MVRGLGVGHIQMDGLVFSRDVQTDGTDQFLMREFVRRDGSTEWICEFWHLGSS